MENDQNQDFELDEEIELVEDTPSKTTEDVVTLSKKEFKQLDRKARAYEATKNTPNKKTPSQEGTNDYEEKIARLALRVDGYSDDEIDLLQKFDSQNPKQALDNPHVKAAIDSIREQRKAEQAVISTESHKSDIERKFSEAEISKMPLEDLEKALRSTK